MTINHFSSNGKMVIYIERGQNASTFLAKAEKFCSYLTIV